MVDLLKLQIKTEEKAASRGKLNRSSQIRPAREREGDDAILDVFDKLSNITRGGREIE